MSQCVVRWGCGQMRDNMPLNIMINSSKSIEMISADDPHRLTVLRYLIHEGLSHVMKDTPKSVDRETNQLSSHGSTGKFVQVSCSPHHCCALDTNGVYENMTKLLAILFIILSANTLHFQTNSSCSLLGLWSCLWRDAAAYQEEHYFNRQSDGICTH